MKFVVILCLLGAVVADDDKSQDKTTIADATQTSSLTSTTGSLLNSQGFPSSPFGSSISSYPGFASNFSPIQPVSSDFYNTPTAAGVPSIIGGVVPSFPIATRTVLPGTSVVNGAQPTLPVATGVFPSYVGGIPSQYTAQYPVIGSGIVPSVTGVQGVLDVNQAAATGVVAGPSSVPYRFLTTEGLTGIPAQGLQTAQTVGLATIPAFTSGILPAIGNGVLQGQTIPTGVLKTPTGTPSGVPTVPTLSPGNISSGPLTSSFRQA